MADKNPTLAEVLEALTKSDDFGGPGQLLDLSPEHIDALRLGIATGRISPEAIADPSVFDIPQEQLIPEQERNMTASALNAIGDALKIFGGQTASRSELNTEAQRLNLNDRIGQENSRRATQFRNSATTRLLSTLNQRRDDVAKELAKHPDIQEDLTAEIAEAQGFLQATGQPDPDFEEISEKLDSLFNVAFDDNPNDRQSREALKKLRLNLNELKGRRLEREAIRSNREETQKQDLIEWEELIKPVRTQIANGVLAATSGTPSSIVIASRNNLTPDERVTFQTLARQLGSVTKAAEQMGLENVPPQSVVGILNSLDFIAESAEEKISKRESKEETKEAKKNLEDAQSQYNRVVNESVFKAESFSTISSLAKFFGFELAEDTVAGLQAAREFTSRFNTGLSEAAEAKLSEAGVERSSGQFVKLMNTQGRNAVKEAIFPSNQFQPDAFRQAMQELILNSNGTGLGSNDSSQLSDTSNAGLIYLRNKVQAQAISEIENWISNAGNMSDSQKKDAQTILNDIKRESLRVYSRNLRSLLKQ